jgi:hypothetical protein
MVFIDTVVSCRVDTSNIECPGWIMLVCAINQLRGHVKYNMPNASMGEDYAKEN